MCAYASAFENYDSDELDSIPFQPYGQGPNFGIGSTSKPIPQLPSASDYPHPATPKYGGGLGIPAHQSIGYNRPGDKLRARTDELHQDLYHSPFYIPHGWLSGPAPAEFADELKKAESRLKSLAIETTPMGFDSMRI